jgi:hypothetical protein
VLIWLAAAALEIAPIHTGWTVIDEFASRFVYFYTGYSLAPRIFALAQQRRRAERALAGWRIWGWSTAAGVQRLRRLPFVSLALGLPARRRSSRSRRCWADRPCQPLRYCGQLDRHLSGVLPADGGQPRLLSKIIRWITTSAHLGAGDVAGCRRALLSWRAARRSRSCSSARRSGSRPSTPSRCSAR